MFCSLSYRGVAKAIGGIMGWCIGLSQQLWMLYLSLIEGRCVAVDENKLKIKRKGEPIYVFLCAARDVEGGFNVQSKLHKIITRR